MTGNPPTPTETPTAGPRVTEAIRRLEIALHSFETAYLEWTEGAPGSKEERRARLDEASARLAEARAQLAALEQALAAEERAAAGD